jgi:hypothetical protein
LQNVHPGWWLDIYKDAKGRPWMECRLPGIRCKCMVSLQRLPGR